MYLRGEGRMEERGRGVFSRDQWEIYCLYVPRGGREEGRSKEGRGGVYLGE